VRDVLRECLDADLGERVDHDPAVRLDRRGLAAEVERHDGVGLLRQRDAHEVDMKEGAGARLTRNVVDEHGHLAGVQTGQGEQGRLAPAAVGLLEDGGVGLDRRRIRVAPEDHSRQAPFAAQPPDLLAEDGARTDFELRCFSHAGTLPLLRGVEDVSISGRGR